jgi:DegV family protein with EDD domain
MVIVFQRSIEYNVLSNTRYYSEYRREYYMVAIVTDSVADLPPEVAKKMNISVIPLHVHFGSRVYKDGVDLTSMEFYNKLENSTILPQTSAPGPGIFADFFDSIAEKNSEILAIFLSHKFSATYESALQGINLMKRKCHVEVVDSTLAIMGQGLLVIEAAKKALQGSVITDIINMISETVPQIHIRVTLDTLKYLAMGGRVGKVQAFMGSMLKINPILGVKDGEAFPYTRVRSRAKAIEALQQFATGFRNVKALAIEYGSNTDEAKVFAGKIASLFPKVPLYISNVSPVIGTHTGPSVLSITVMEG